MTVTLSEAAARRISKIVAESGTPSKGVRLEVLGGGCSGFQYKFGFADTIEADDVVITRDTACLIIDPSSYALVEGSEIDFGESLMESGFHVVNPNAASSCGCGSSFSVKE